MLLGLAAKRGGRSGAPCCSVFGCEVPGDRLFWPVAGALLPPQIYAGEAIVFSVLGPTVSSVNNALFTQTALVCRVPLLLRCTMPPPLLHCRAW